MMISLQQLYIPFAIVLSLCAVSLAQQHQHNANNQAQQQHSNNVPAYIIPTVNRQGGGLGSLAGLGGLGSGFGGLGGLGGLSGLSGLSGLGGGGGSGNSGGGFSGLLSSLSGLSGGSMLSTALPLLMVVGLGAMLVPLLGGAFFRESQKRGLPSISPAFVDGIADILEKFVRALDAVEKKY